MRGRKSLDGNRWDCCGEDFNKEQQVNHPVVGFPLFFRLCHLIAIVFKEVNLLISTTIHHYINLCDIATEIVELRRGSYLFN